MSATSAPSTSTYTCSRCHEEFDSSFQRDEHIRRSHFHGTNGQTHTSVQPTPPTYSCRLCRSVFPNRSLLHVHRVRAHRNQVGGSDLQERPWRDNENPFEDVTDNDAMEELYNDNDVYILAPNQFLSPLKSIYNMPVKRQLSDNAIKNMLESIYHHPKQGKAFKFNLAAGVIMENREDGSLRYFKPSTNMTLLDHPISIRDRASLQRAIDSLQGMDLNDLIRNYRINSKYFVKFITNLELYAYNTSFPLGANHTILPDYVRNNPYICSATTSFNAQQLSDYCVFIALGHFHHPNSRWLQTRVKDYYHDWNMYCQNNGICAINRDVSPRIELSDVYSFEQCFKINVNIFQLNPDMSATSIYKSTSDFPQIMNLNLHDKHVNLITDLEKYAKAYACIYCDTLCKSPFLLRRHQSTCSDKTKLKFPGGFYKVQTTLFERLEHIGIKVPRRDRYFPFFACYDFEAILQKLTVDESKKLKLTHRHIPVSCSIASNVPGFTEPTCIVHYDPSKLVEEMFYVLDKIRSHAIPLIHGKWAKYITQLQQKITRRTDALEQEDPFSSPDDNDTIESSDSEDDSDKEERKREKHRAKLSKRDPYCRQLVDLEREFMRYTNQFCVISFNGGRYDECLIKQPLVKYLIEQEKTCSLYSDVDCSEIPIDHNARASPLLRYYGLSKGREIFTRDALCTKEMGAARVIKRGNRYVSIANNFYNFLDLCQYLPPATSYDKFLKAYGIEVGKQYFCYEWLDHYDKLNEQLPPYPGEAWYSSLKDKDILDEEHNQFIASGANGTPPLTGQQKYEMIQQQWRDNGWSTMRDLLIYYNNADVFPFVQALNIMLAEYFRQGLDIFKIAVSIPGVSRYKMMQYATKSNTMFPLFNQADRDLFFLFKSQICAGASLIITRLAQKGVTPIKAGSDKLVQSCIGLDANALYCAQQALDMPSFAYVRRFKESDFKPVLNKRFYLMHVWLKYLADTTGWKIHTRSTMGSEVRVGPYFLDGFALTNSNEKIALEMYGCFYHGHINCQLNPMSKNIDKYVRTFEREAYLKKENYRVVSIWECEFKRIMEEKPELKREYQKYMPEFYRNNRGAVSKERILEAIGRGKLYGFALVNVKVPHNLREHYDSFPPIFANHLVEREHLSPIMRQHVDEQGINFNKGRRLLLTGMEAEEILLSTKMIAWYMHHGIEVSDVLQVIEFVPSKPFKDFVSDIAARRLEGARDPNKKIIAEIYKLMG